MTDDGIFFRQRAQEIIELADRLEKSFVERQNDISGMVVIGASEAVGSQTLAKLIKVFSEKYPAVQFTLIKYFGMLEKKDMSSGGVIIIDNIGREEDRDG